jgi:H+-transporting ATPase
VCSVDQSAITGESLASDKFLGDIAYYTCGVKRGKVYGVVTVQAPESFVGKTASLVSGMSAVSDFYSIAKGP